MARRGRRRGGRKSKSIPIAPIIPLAFVAYKSLHDYPAISDKLNSLSMLTTGYNAKSGIFSANSAIPFWTGELVGIAVHMVANKTINKHIRKATMGYLSL